MRAEARRRLLAIATISILAAAAVSACSQAPNAAGQLSVGALAARMSPPDAAVDTVGYLVPESVRETTAGVEFELGDATEPGSPRIAVRMSEPLPGDFSFVQRVLANDLVAGAGGVFDARSVVLVGEEGPSKYRGIRVHALTMQTPEEQFEQLFGRRERLESVDTSGTWLDESPRVELYSDERGAIWMWDAAMRIWLGTLGESTDTIPGRFYPGEASREEALTRADAVATKYYQGAGEVGDMRRTYVRRAMEPDGMRESAIVSYDVDYQRYINGIRVNDGINVTVFARSGGSDYVRNRLAEEVSSTLQPAVSPVRAHALVREQLAAKRASDPTALQPMPPDAELVSVELSHWGGRLTWTLGYDWEPGASGNVLGCDHSFGEAVVDAATGETSAGFNW